MEFEDRIDGSWSKIELRMKYTDGQKVRLGDRLKLGPDDGGAVVAVIDTGQYTDEHPETQWGYLKRGAMIKFPLYGLIHYEDAEPDLQLIERTPSR